MQFPQSLYSITFSRQSAAGTKTSWMSTREAIDLECYEEQSKERPARHLEEDDRMYEHLRREQARNIAESDARLLELRMQVD